MIFEISTNLQDILDHIVEAPEPLNLNQERLMQAAATAAAAAEQHLQVARAKLDQEGSAATEMLREDTQLVETQAMSSVVEQAQRRPEKRRARWTDARDEGEAEESEGLRFDRMMVTKDFDGNEIDFDTIHKGMIKYRDGPVSRISKVYCYQTVSEISDDKAQLKRTKEPHLLLKESRFLAQGKDNFMRGYMLELEARLEKVSRLNGHPNLLQPLGYNIKRSMETDDEHNEEWYVGILVTLAPKGSMHDLLETVTILRPDNFRSWALQLLEGLQFLHRNGMAHSSVHINNILLEKDDTGNVVTKLSDAHFQVSLHLMQPDSSLFSREAKFLGWVSPELKNCGRAEASFPTDIWDLGGCGSPMQTKCLLT